jgi:biopolymer transport protein ExbD
MNRSRPHRMEAVADPNIIPFIDIMLVLLIVFLVAAPTPTTDIKVDLPPPGYRPIFDPGGRVTVVALYGAERGVIVRVDEEEVAPVRLAEAVLRRAGVNNPALAGDAELVCAQARVMLRADPNIAYARVVGALEQLKAAGLRRVSIASASAT